MVEAVTGEPVPQEIPHRHLRETLFLVGQAGEGDIRVVPGRQWGFHYPQGSETRQEQLQGLLQGKLSPDEIAPELRPDAMMFNVDDMESLGPEAVGAQIRSASAAVAQYDYARFARFVAGMKGRDVDLETVQALYDGVAIPRIQKKMVDAYGATGKRQMLTALEGEVAELEVGFGSLTPLQRILSALKIEWLCEDMRNMQRQPLVGTRKRDGIIGQLTEDERAVVDRLTDSYRRYAQAGEERAYETLVKAIQQQLPTITAEQPERAGPSESMQELLEELEPLMEQIGPPGTPDDPGIPPEDNDEYHTPPAPSEHREATQPQPWFEIRPSGESTRPLAGYYTSGRKSYYDRESRTWSKRKQMTPYSGSVSGDKRYTISAKVNAGVKAIPIPNNYALDSSSLESEGTEPTIHRDQNGCFYVEAGGDCSFSIDFLEEQPPFIGHPIAEDTTPLYEGVLSDQTESAISRLQGDAFQKAEQARAYVFANHWYPGGGDVQAAQALQLKLRNESTADTYMGNLDASEYLECYSANTLFAAMMRKADVPTRLVTGHKVEGAQGGKAVIDSSTGHAWAEVWDGQRWRRVDATPQPKPADRQDTQDDQKTDAEPTDAANDGGFEPPTPSDKPADGQQTGTATPEDMSNMSEVSDADLAHGEKSLQAARELLENMQTREGELRDAVQTASTFDELEKLADRLADEQLLDEMREELERRAEAREEQMKKEISSAMDQMTDDGFLDQDRHDELAQQLEADEAAELDRVREQLERERTLYDQYLAIQAEVMPYVDQWFDHFVRRLPREYDVEFDEDARTRRGSLDRRAIMRARDIAFGTVYNPRMLKPSITPLFIEADIIDVSGSMSGDKLEMARKLLVFRNELFSRISREFGYIRFANYVFSDTIKRVKGYDQDYDSPRRYEYDDGQRSTVKARLMEAVKAKGGTDMLPAIKQAAGELNTEVREFPDHASSFCFMGDGKDTQGNSANVRRFLELADSERGFGRHVLSAIMLGDDSQRAVLADIFGDANTTVAPDFEALIEESMRRFDIDITTYLKEKQMDVSLSP